MNKIFQLKRYIGIYLLLICLTNYSTLWAQKKQSLLWSISGNGLAQESYLYGTMHSKSKKVFEFNSVVLDKFDASKAFAAELKLDSAAMMKAATALKMGEGYSLKKMLKKSDYKLVNKLMKQELGMQLEAFDNHKPVYIMTMIQQSELMSGEMPKFLDQYLHDRAAEENKTILGVETIEEQTKAFGALPYDEQISMLIKKMKTFEKDKQKSQAQNARLLQLYLNGDLDGMLAMFNEDPMPQKMKEELLDKRNAVMVERIIPMITSQSTFIAIGAAHLPGPTGVIELLRKKGYTLTPIPFDFDGSAYNRLTAKKKVVDVSKWVDYTSEAGKFKCKFPNTPRESTQKQTNDAGKELTINTFQYIDLTKGSMVLTYNDNPEVANKPSAELFKKQKENIEQRMKAQGGKVLAMREINYKGNQGVEMDVEALNGNLKMTIRIFVVGTRTYSLTSTSTPGNDTTLERQAFFNSFEILK